MVKYTTGKKGEVKATRLAQILTLTTRGYSPEDLEGLNLAELGLVYLGSEVTRLRGIYMKSDNGIKPEVLKEFQRKRNQYHNQMELVGKTSGPERAEKLNKRYPVIETLDD